MVIRGIEPVLTRRATALALALYFGLFSFPAKAEPGGEGADGCSFDYLLSATSTLTAGFRDVTSGARAASKEWALLKTSLPNLQRFWVDEHADHLLLIGWQTLPEDMAQYSKEQAESKLTQTAELSRRTIHAGQDFSFEVARGTPITILGTLNYQDHGEAWRDAFADVIATSHCMFSIKLTAALKDEEEPYWKSFRNRVEAARRDIEAKEGPVTYSSGQYFSRTGLENAAILIALSAIIGTVGAWAVTRRYCLVPSTPARNYAIFLVVACTLGLLKPLIEVSNFGARFRSYESVLPLLVSLLLALAYLLRRGRGTLTCLLFYVGGIMAASVVYWALGWTAQPPMSRLIGMALGVAVLGYAMKGSLQPRADSAG
jgi:hypothetical protein